VNAILAALAPTPSAEQRGTAGPKDRLVADGDDEAGFAAVLGAAGARRGLGLVRGAGVAGADVVADDQTAALASSLHTSLSSSLAARLKAEGSAAPATAAHDIEDSLWTERTTARGKADALKRKNAGRGDGEDVAPPASNVTEEDDAPQPETAPQREASSSPSWLLSSLSSGDRVGDVAEVPPGPLLVATDHLRGLLPEGGRVLAASANHVRLELPHPSGPMLLDVSLKSGVVDVRARGGAAAEMAWRVPELAAALQSAGVRLGNFEVAPLQKTGDSDAADDGPAGDRQNSDAREAPRRRSGVLNGLVGAFTSP